MATTSKNGILIKNIYYMLGYAFQNIKQVGIEKIKGVEFDNIHNLFAEILYRGVSYLLKSGLHREYIPVKESLTTVRGRIDINATLKNFMQRRMMIGCEYDEFSENNLFNQILLSTVQLLIKQKDVDKESKVRLKKLMVFFSEVDTIDLKTVRWKSLHFDRNTRTYQFLLNLCHLLVEGMVQSNDHGDYLMQSFTDEYMNRLYEKFILEYYKKHHPDLKAAASKIDWDIEGDRIALLPDMKTDITLTGPERTLIIDAKYYSRTTQNNFGKETIHSHNVYQLYSYVTNLNPQRPGLVDGMLLYAKVEGDNELGSVQQMRSGNALYFETLDLNTEFDEIKSQLDSIAKMTMINSVVG